jgi:coenzyme F420-0:L-glutamate ligase/coenzyme F420-1:gamma-L-glutamate ligase
VTPAVSVLAVEGIGEITPQVSLAGEITARASLADGDFVCISQKVVSKEEGRIRELDEVRPSERARRLAGELGKEPEMVELVLADSRRVVRAERGVLITETHSGLICANAGIDSSNVPGERRVALLPEDPDASARRIRAELRSACGAKLGVVISDSFGRPWRLGQSEVAIGCAGISPLDDWRGRGDRQGHELEATAIATADQIAAAADLAREKSSGTPVVVVRGLGIVTAEDGPGATALLRPAAEDLFR